MAAKTSRGQNIATVAWLLSFFVFIGLVFFIPSYTHGQNLDSSSPKYVIANTAVYILLLAIGYFFLGWIPILILKARAGKKK